MKFTRLIPLIFISVFLSVQSYAQGGYEDLLFEEVENPNPVYMPVVGIGPGLINYFGELENDYKNLLAGRPSIRVNLYQILNKPADIRMNVYFVWGRMTGENRSFVDPTNRNVNFQSELYDIGVNFEYGFGGIFKGEKRVRPFISIGAEFFSFTTKTDLYNSGVPYEYLDDGTIRDPNGDITRRDMDYESNASDRLNYYGRESFETENAAIVGDFGFDLKMSPRVTLRLASSLHYTFTDDLDMISSANTQGWVGNESNDLFALTYCTINLDLFSSSETIVNELLFADVTGDFDYELYRDNDRDEVPDISDQCLGTPRGVVVDSVGCPLDQDDDGVPDYMDKEFFTRNGAIVDENGVEMHPDKILESMAEMQVEAVNRDEQYMVPITLSTWSKYDQGTGEIPEKFSALDKDKDNYISFDELLDAIDGFFDFDSNFTTEDIYELNEFFFSQ